ncbi:N-glycosidase YbiA-like [Asterias rubens]|uniref:N-glycosidase YbiA-like n=1 Tax=Asterias rubens TaxID=7604 RepID=UPI001455D3AD|nr:N-glycosidase YbiA-like [Asterias rubens]
MPPKRKMPPAKKAEKKTKSVESASPEAAGGDATEERYTFFYTVKSPFSQFYPAEFTVDGVKYMHAEQYMMHQKAVLFGDDSIAEQMLQEVNPPACKALGRKVQGFDQQRWNDNRCIIVKKGNFAKFSQNPDLKRLILDTDGTVLVEASPRDCIWGIGLGADNPKAQRKATWRGKNLLGYALTEVREQLKQE